MKYRALDENGDYSFGFGQNDFLTDGRAVAQAVGTKLKLFKGEWWENINDGLPFFQSIAGRPSSLGGVAAVDLIIQARIKDAPGVQDITSFQSTFDPKIRKYTCKVTVSTIYGTSVEVTV